MKKEMLNLVICLMFCLLSVSGCFDNMSDSGPAVIYVSSDGDADFAMIQDAINAAPTNSIISVSNGMYHETLVIDKALTITGSNKGNATVVYDKNEINHVDIICINVDNCTIKGFKIINVNSSPDVTGININISSSNTSILNNTISCTTEGICIGVGSTNDYVFQNNIINNSYGINIEYAASYNCISHNVITSNTLYGMYLRVSRNNLISWNNISDNQFGIRLKSSTDNKIFGNVLTNNQRGIYLCCGSRGNSIFYNDFINNSEWNAKDSANNIWNNETVGNYWDNYEGIDSDSDGISETYYNIPGGNNHDNYPLMNPILK